MTPVPPPARMKPLDVQTVNSTRPVRVPRTPAGLGGGEWRFGTRACSPETMTTDRRACVLVFLASLSGGCAYYSPQSLVATNILATGNDTFSRSSIRVEAQVCG